MHPLTFGSHFNVRINAFRIDKTLADPAPETQRRITQTVLEGLTREIPDSFSRISPDGDGFDFVCQDTDDSRFHQWSGTYTLGKFVENFGTFLLVQQRRSAPIHSQATLEAKGREIGARRFEEG